MLGPEGAKSECEILAGGKKPICVQSRFPRVHLHLALRSPEYRYDDITIRVRRKSLAGRRFAPRYMKKRGLNV